MRRAPRWLFLIDAVIVALLGLMAVVDDATHLFKLAFFVLTIGAFFWELDSFVRRGAIWVVVTAGALVAAIGAGRAHPVEILDLPYFVAVLVLVFVVNSRRSEARRRVEELLDAERRRADHLNDVAELKADFTAMVVHEFGNPLAALRRQSELLRLDGLGPEARERALHTIAHELRTLDTLVADVQTAVAVERDDLFIDRRPVRMGDLVASVVPFARSVSDGHAFAVDVGVTADAVVIADADRISQVLRNLVSNAVKYSPVGSAITVRVAPAPTGDAVSVEVHDEGCGVHDDDLDRIFSRYERGRASRGTSGMGLGLSISRRLLAAHGTDLTVRSGDDRGSVFRFELPLARGAAAPGGAVAAEVGA